MFCLPPQFAEKFKSALKDGTINPEKLIRMTSNERRNFFKDIVGEADAQEVNAQLESKLILKDQKTGMVTWAKKIAGISEQVRTDIISRINKLDKILTPQTEKAFLNDLVAKRFGAEITLEEAKNVAEGAKQVQTLKDKIPADSPIGSQARLDYGLKFVKFQEYIKELKGDNNIMPFKEWIKSPKAMIESLGGLTKSILSSFDNSFFGRQGIKMLYTHPTMWADAFIKSWGDMVKELKGQDAMIPIKADIYSRPNALNGKYKAMNLDIGINSEEAFPSSLPEKIPVLGRAFKAAESAFNGAALRMRSDGADALIKKAEEFGVNMLDKKQASGLGDMINSLTGRGDMGLTSSQSKFINATFFSIKFLKANYDTLTGHNLGFGIEEGPARDFARKEAATNLAKIVTTIAAINVIANAISPGSASQDPRSTNFGKIKVRNTTFDTTGGMAALVTLAARLTPTVHDGKLGFWTQSGAGKWTDLTAGKYGQATITNDVIPNFFEGKLSPLAGLLRDIWKGQNFSGQPVTPENAAQNLFEPLPFQTYQDLQNPGAAPTVASMILDGLGFSTYTPPVYKKK